MSDAPRSRLLVGLAFLGFVSIGLPDGLLGVAWPSVRRYFGLSIDALGPLLIAVTSGYVVSSFSCGRILKHINVGGLLALSCVATAASLFGYALAPAWAWMVSCGLLAGLGAGAIDAGINTYAATYHGTRMLNSLHAFYGVGAAAGPLLMSQLLAHDFPWQSGYAVVAAGQVLLAFCFAATRTLWPGPDNPDAANGEQSVSAGRTLRLPAAQAGIAAFFVYTGVEATAGAWSYSLLTEGCAIDAATAGVWVSLFWAGLTVGRILIGIFGHRIASLTLLRACMVAIAACATLISLNVNIATTGIALAVLGVASGPIFPSLIAGTPSRVGEAHTANAVGFQVAAAATGQALLPSAVGVIARRFGISVVGPFLVAAAVILLSVHEVLVHGIARAQPPPIRNPKSATRNRSRA